MPSVTLFIDLLPLSPPSEGIHSNKLFLLREFYAYLVMTLLALHQFRKGIPVLPYPPRKLFRDTFLVSGVCVGILYGLILTVGFPLPFTTLTIVPVWTVLTLVCLGVQWAKILRETVGAVMMFIGMVKLWLCDILLVFVYPPYFYVFSTLSTNSQIALVLLLPVIKVLMRKLFSRAVQHLGDETPGLVVFNADVFGSLFVAYCMQRSPSTWTTTGIMMLDVVTMAISLRDVAIARKELLELERQLDKAHAWRSYRGEVGHISLGIRMPTTLERASILLDQAAGEYTNGPSIDIVDVASKNRIIDYSQSGRKIFGFARIHPADHGAVAVGRRSPNAVIEASYTLKVRRLLCMAEFLLLLNYVEAMIPLIFSIYLVATFYLPNRDYYAIYDSMDHHQLFQTLQNSNNVCEPREEMPHHEFMITELPVFVELDVTQNLSNEPSKASSWIKDDLASLCCQLHNTSEALQSAWAKVEQLSQTSLRGLPPVRVIICKPEYYLEAVDTASPRVWDAR
ncbi:hypothetical protein PHYSODRAFT_338768 [Phytophthora sojae]|uniref:Uncharacterized protein n=1 Tax=Phytophthora sojae (strain P6497) TaxID=1094619 RepID=G5A340_PHYSP|nr:hypothetical protein PHYSODRAFT_338768 [Phytophthora sojae]EGZ10080.1 hypothetical protein PHYSODRAFT_338768 [Phytophthora sojae]|eukprot:XP_009534941.1 hypothetical protein PHYSODRAFT_338768 [Phytophthora sojae]